MCAKAIDMTGKRFGRLEVLYRNGSTKSNKALWRCRCDCGKEKDIIGSELRSGRVVSCGCYHREQFKEMLHQRRQYNINPGDRIGSLTILEETKMGEFKCLCDCGREFVTTGKILSVGDATTCGCGIGRINHTFKDETNNRYGKLTVLEFVGTDKNNQALWKCRCDCGNIKITTGASLRNGSVSSCGCLSSKGEQKLQSLFTQMNISFETQKSFTDLYSPKGFPLFFDFYLIDYNILIEYQGIQHYECTNTWWNTPENFEQLRIRDNRKREYCKEKEIPLIEIPYWDYEKINDKYIECLLEKINENISS